ncbi:hypothetical protein QFC22_001166 [Naganishia vaughanmartiniae]|uniref:Uncharacterized protein n=1 Tax=Naganishia vaughanmartiniae TaxID=1424756 RepID=A0ACC2XLX2_9TREE|nr:hypothetical protein QFC22_001166 [Naganishia vaughanmartiniae]
MQTEPPVTQEGPDFDLSKIEYVEGFDDPLANVVLVCSDKKALRIHDYFLKTHSLFFREMLEAGTKGGPIGLDENSLLLEFIMTKVIGKRPAYSLLTRIAVVHSYAEGKDLESLVRLHSVSEKYIFEQVGAFIRELIVEYASDYPPLALRFAVNLDPPNEPIVRAALANFSNRMPHSFGGIFTVPYGDSPSTWCPAGWSLSQDYARGLGVDAYHAYVFATRQMDVNELYKWDWKTVTDLFVKSLKIAKRPGGEGKLAVYEAS